MTLNDLIQEANILSDDEPDVIEMISFVNACTSIINVKAKAIFPSLTINDMGTIMFLPDKWVRSMYVPFTAGRYKQKEASQFEYSDMYSQFEMALAEFISGYPIPDQYQDKTGWVTDPTTGELVKNHYSWVYEQPALPWWW